MNLRDVERRAFDLVASSTLRGIELRRWLYNGVEVKLPFQVETHPDDLHVFRAEVDVPSSSYTWFLKLVISGNARLKVDGELYAGIDEAHTYVPINCGKHYVELVASPRTLFGFHEWRFSFDDAYLVEVAWRPLRVGLFVLNLVKLAESMPAESSLKRDLENLLYRVMFTSRVNPSLKQIALALTLLYKSQLPTFTRQDLPRPYGDYVWLASVYGIGVLKGYLSDVPSTPVERVIAEAARIESELEEGLEELRKRYPKSGLLYVVGHSHIDAAWLWPRRETVEKVLRTFSTAVKLAENYEFTYVQSSAQYYEWVEELDKALFEKIKRLVEAGKWVIVGGMWVESDTNLVDGESLARQFLYGQRYFLEKFNRLAKIGWLPDSFGFSGNLPQILKKSGIEVFVTHKVMWNDTNEFPHHSFRWIGIDGSEIPVQVLVTSYNEPLTPVSVYKYWSKYKQKDTTPFTIYAYGYGDGGGGPTREMLEYVSLLNKLPMLPDIKHLSEEEYLSKVREHVDEMPTWSGEMYVEFHRGTYTTNIAVKNAVAEAERTLIMVEALLAAESAIFGRKSRASGLDELWKKLLFNQFHDIVPGSSIREVYEDALRELSGVVSEASKIGEEVLGRLVDEGKEGFSLVVFNALPWSFKFTAKIPKERGVPGDVECQEDLDGYYVLVDTAPLGVKSYRLSSSTCRANSGVKLTETSEGLFVENEYFEVLVNNEGELTSIRLKGGGAELLREPVKLVVHVDKPGVFDAWELTSDFLHYGLPVKTIEKPRVVVNGPLVSCIEVVKGFEDSEIVQRMCFYKGKPYIELKTRLKWWSKGVAVKQWFKTTISSVKAFYDAPFGAIERSTKMESSWERAMFEVPAVRWADVSDGEKGLAIIAPSRHGYSTVRGDIALTLIRSPLFPNPWSDLGEFEVTYYVYPHRGSYEEAEVPRVAREVFYAPLTRVVKGKALDFSLVKLEPPRANLSAFKCSYDGDGFVLRLYNPYSKPVSVKLVLGFKALELAETNIVELGASSTLARDTSEVVIELKPFEIKTLKIIAK